MKRFLLIGFSFLLLNHVNAQVSINTDNTTPHSSAMLEIKSNNRGLLAPRMTKIQRNAIPNPATGLLIYQTTDSIGFFVNKGTPATPSWQKLGSEFAIPSGTIIISENYPDPGLTAAGFSIYRLLYIDSIAQYGQYGSWTLMDTVNSPTYDLYTPITWVVGGDNLYVQSSSSSETVPGTYDMQIAKYNIVTDTWTLLPNAFNFGPRRKPTMVWTGTELIIWGGLHPLSSPYFNDGRKYTPATDTWVVMGNPNSPSPRIEYFSHWTGTELIVWGGHDAAGNHLNTGAKYNPGTNTWTTINTTGAPGAFADPTIVYGNNTMFVWGGVIGNTLYQTNMYRYNVTANTWSNSVPGNNPLTRFNASGVYSSGSIYVWGGNYYIFSGGWIQQPRTDGFVFNTTTGNWGPNVGMVSNRSGQVLIRRNTELYAWAGTTATFTPQNDGSYVTIPTGIISPMGTAPVSPRYQYYADTMPGNKILYWGGSTPSNVKFNDGVFYNTLTNTWSPLLATEGGPGVFYNGAYATINGKFLIWGGKDATNQPTKAGFIYDPAGSSFGNPQTLKLYLYKKN
jgi:N-acetylneuraminic acid mutarotase